MCVCVCVCVCVWVCMCIYLKKLACDPFCHDIIDILLLEKSVFFWGEHERNGRGSVTFVSLWGEGMGGGLFTIKGGESSGTSAVVAAFNLNHHGLYGEIYNVYGNLFMCNLDEQRLNN